MTFPTHICVRKVDSASSGLIGSTLQTREPNCPHAPQLLIIRRNACLPHLHSPIPTRSDHLILKHGMMLRPCDNFCMHLFWGYRSNGCSLRADTVTALNQRSVQKQRYSLRQDPTAIPSPLHPHTRCSLRRGQNMHAYGRIHSCGL